MRSQTQIDVSPAASDSSHASLGRGIVWGLIGGLVGTIVMDVVLVAALAAMGLPADTSFSIIGDTAAGVFALLGFEIAGGSPLGAAMHYLLGLGLGAIFGVAVTQVDLVRATTIKKGIALGIVYIEVVSQPILAASPLVLQMTTAETIQWFGICACMHLIWGAVLGGLVGYRLRAPGNVARA